MLSETAAMLDALYGRCDASHGAIVIVVASRRKILKAYPLGSSKLLVDAAKAMQGEPGSYYKVNPMDYGAIQQRIGEIRKHAVGNQSEVRSIVSLHADVDAGKRGYLSRRAALWAVRQMPLLPTIIINSDGGENGLHCYWLLEEPHIIRGDVDRKRCHDLSKAWQSKLRKLCGGRLDSTANLDRVLRCVGVPRLDGRDVTCEECDFSRMYKLEDFERE